MKKENRIYINSFLQKESGGDDTEFTVSLGAQYEFDRVQLDQCIIENQFTSFYDSHYGDMTKLGVRLQGQQPIIVVLDQFFENFDELIAYVNDDVEMTANNLRMINTMEAYPRTFRGLPYRVISCKFQHNGVDVQTYISGLAWRKLGYDFDVESDYLLEHIGTKGFDMSQSPVINIEIANLPATFKTAYGSHSFTIPNMSSFGSRIYYVSTQHKTCQHIHVGKKISRDRLHIRLTNCDFKKMMTARQNATSWDNQNGIEIILVLTLTDQGLQ